MRIKNLTINSFGKLQNYSLNFENGLNVVYGENEYGKSTIMSFIKLILYGKFKSNTIDDKDLREKYAPWNGEKMSGSITIEYKDNTYRIEKEISSRSAGYDKTKVYNLSQGKTITLAKNEEVGEYFLGIDAVGFERSSYIKNIGDVDFKIKKTRGISKDTVLDKMLSNLASGGEEDVSQSEILSRVQGAINDLRTATGKGGAIPKLDKDIENLELKISRIKEFEKSQEQEKNRRRDLEILIEEQKKVRAQIEKAENCKRMKEIKDLSQIVSEKDEFQKDALEHGINPDSYEEVLETLEKYNNELQYNEINIKHYKELAESGKEDFVKITQDEEDLFKRCVANFESLKEKSNNIKYFSLSNGELSEFELPKSIVDIKSEIKFFEDSKIKKRDEMENIKANSVSKYKTCIISGVAFLIFSILAMILNLFIPAMIFAGLFLVAGCTYLYLNYKLGKKQEAFSAEMEKIDNKVAGLKSKIEEETSKLRYKSEEDCKAVCEKIKFLMNQKNCKDYNDFYEKRALTKEKEKYEKTSENYVNERRKIFKDINEYLSGKNISIDLNRFNEYLESLRAYKEKSDDLNNRIKYKSQVLGLEETDKNGLESLLSNLSGEDISDIDENSMWKLRKRLEELKSMNLYDSYKKSSENIVKHPENLELLELDLSKLKTKEEKMNYYCDCLSMAKEVLEETVNEMRYNFSPKLNGRASEIFKKLTGGKYDYIRVDKDYKFVIGDDGISRSAEHFSAGTIDQAYLALRIAISELISEERVPFLLDDTLMQYDDNRLDEVMKFLKDYADSTDIQSIIFTCHKSVSERAMHGY